MTLLFSIFFLAKNNAQLSPGAPQEIHLSFTHSPETTMTVMWQTEGETKTTTLQYGDTQKLGKEVTGTTETYPAATGIIHKVDITKLSPSKTYYYKVGDKEAGWSGTFSFKTAPAKPENFTFAAMGDVDTTDDAHKNISIIKEEKPAFVLVLGDLSYANGKHGVWDNWFNMIQPAAETIPFMPTLGNHEFEKVKKAKWGIDAYIARLSLPGNEAYYSFDYAGAHFISLNCLNVADKQQLEWLENDLKAAQKNKASWIISYLHYPPYSSSSSHGSDLNVRKILCPLWEKYGVDMVLTGHDHDYERTFPLKNDKAASKDKTKYKKGAGTIYVVSGGGGAHLYGFQNEVPEWSAKRESMHEIFKASVAQNKLSVKALRTKDKSVMDEFEITK